MPKTAEKQKKQDLGIFYTPPAVVNFIFDILTIWKNREDKESMRWQSRKPRPHFPSVIDPAVGEGIFLKTAIERGFTGPDWIFGLDIDENAVRKWKGINLLKQFGGKEEDLDAHFFHQNGLEPIKWEQHIRTYRYKLKQEDIKNQQFDAVVGNPPYGGLGVDLKNKKSPEAIALLNALSKYEIFWWKKTKQSNGQKKPEGPLFQNLAQSEITNRFLGINEVARMAEGIPIEILFTERFLQLAKPGGWIAIIIPDGILTNSNAHYVREFIADKAKVEAIVSLPRGTFKQAGTSAKTSILFLRKRKEKEKLNFEYPVFLSSIESADEENFNKVAKQYEKFYNQNNPMNNSNNNQKVVVIKDEKGKEAVMVRVDKTLKEMMEERPSSRWSADYWHPMYEENIKQLKSSAYRLAELRQFVPEGPAGITYGQVGTRKISEDGAVQYLQVVNIVPTGIDIWIRNEKVDEGSPNDPERSRLRKGDILFVNQGVGSLGKTIVFLSDGKFNVSQHIDVIRPVGISSFFVSVYLKTKFGRIQIERFNSGVSGQINITFDQIKSVKIPILPGKVQNHIESEYKKMSAFHDKAMEAKKKGDEAGYKKNIEIAERMLRDLIARTEAVIRGEREDVI